MRIGMMVGSDKERPRADRLAGLIDDATSAEAAGFSSFWFPQVPGYVDALTAMALLGRTTSTIELGTAVVPMQTRHPMIMAQQAVTTQEACGGRFALGMGPSHDWIIDGSWEFPITDRFAWFVTTSTSYWRPSRDLGQSTSTTTVFACTARWMSLTSARCRSSGGAGPTMLRIAASEPTERSFGWPTNARSPSTSLPESGRCQCFRTGRTPHRRRRTGGTVRGWRGRRGPRNGQRGSGHAHFSPNYVRLLEHGDAEDVGDTMATGSEATILTRLQRYRDAGVTDLAARVVPVGRDPETRQASRKRTQDFLASLCPTM